MWSQFHKSLGKRPGSHLPVKTCSIFHVAKYQQFLDAERGKAEEGGATESSDVTKVTKPKAAKGTKLVGDKTPKPIATQPPKPKPAPTQPSKAVSKKK
ncbi:hypothetical protein Tco_0953925 [Tanacetum coccineum]|uniref:Uncharacterized protein n=1 Tax=Tanacetum coccineum TaxID=301880 RepID=A0ABQ5E198_9ASTR